MSDGDDYALTARCGKCSREMSNVSYNKHAPGRTVGICPEHGVMYANPNVYE